jgi:hypothetical protein
MSSPKRQLFVFRPGEEARMLARCQFGAYEDGSAGATMTYPIKGFPWRKNVMKSYAFSLSPETVRILFDEPKRIRAEFPAHCLDTDALWNDSSEKANAITRDKATGTLCYSIGISAEGGAMEEQYCLRENDVALTSSALFGVIARLIEPHEQL